VRRGFVEEARDEGWDARVGFDLGGIEIEFATPEQPRLLTQIDDALEEAREDLHAEALPDAGQAGVVGEVFVERIAEVPAMGQVAADRLAELALGADAVEEHHQFQLEEDHRVDARPTPLGVQLTHPLAHEAQIQCVL
jgi:hypothetical protein